MPSWGIFARHVTNLQVRDVELRLMSADARPAVYLEDAVAPRFTNVRLPRPVDGGKNWVINVARGFFARDATGLPDGEMRAVTGKVFR